MGKNPRVSLFAFLFVTVYTHCTLFEYECDMFIDVGERRSCAPTSFQPVNRFISSHVNRPNGTKIGAQSAGEQSVASARVRHSYSH